MDQLPAISQNSRTLAPVESLNVLRCMSSDEIYEMIINMGPEQLLEKRYQFVDSSLNVLHALIMRDTVGFNMSFCSRADTLALSEAITYVARIVPALIDEDVLRCSASYHDAAFKTFFHISRPSATVCNNVLHESASNIPGPFVIQMLLDGNDLYMALFHYISYRWR